jgi:uncharacterized protein (TIGR02147 family)
VTENQKFPLVAAFLKKKIAEIQSKNARLSIRSICIKSGISTGRMTDLLNGRKALSEYYAEKLSRGLRLDRKDREELFDLISTHSRKTPRRIDMSENDLAVLSWENHAILNLLKTRESHSTRDWIAERLAIPLERTDLCLEALFNLGLIKKTEDGFKAVSAYISTSWNIPNESTKEELRRVLRKSIEALEETLPHQREYTSLTLAIDDMEIETAKKLIEEFRKKFGRQLNTGTKSEVYNLSIQFFPLTRVKNPQG